MNATQTVTVSTPVFTSYEDSEYEMQFLLWSQNIVCEVSFWLRESTDLAPISFFV